MKHLSIASEQYRCDHDGLIRPISALDAEIIENILSVMSVSNANSELINIVRDWKKIQDGHILNRLSELVIEEEEESDDESRFMIDIQGHVISMAEIQYIMPSSEWRKDRRMFLITINPEDFVHAKSLTRNIEIEFYIEEDRNKCLEYIKTELTENKSIKFIKIN